MSLPDIHQQLPALQQWLNQSLPNLGTIQDIKRFSGGFSNITYRISNGQQSFVLRMPPPGSEVKTAHDMSREFRVLTALQPYYASIPKPLAFCDNPTVLGAPFYIMEYLEGMILRPNSSELKDLSADNFTTLSTELIINLATLHSIDLQSSGLIQLGKPEGYVNRQVTGWINRYYQSETDQLETINQVADWLQQQTPREQAPAMLHNDYKYDNVIFSRQQMGEIVGVLDWEMATVGDPLMDLGAALAYWFEAGDPEPFRDYNITWLPGNLSRSDCAELYATNTGRDISDLLFYYVFGLFKNAVIVQQIYYRWKKGLHNDDRFGALIHLIKLLGKHAVRTLEKNSIS